MSLILTKSISHSAILALLPEAIDPAGLGQGWVVTSMVPNGTPYRVAHLLRDAGVAF